MERMEKLNPDRVIRFTNQFRMHPHIWSIPQELFYKYEVHSVFRNSNPLNFFISKQKPVLFVNIEGKEVKFQKGYLNGKESEAAFQLLDFFEREMGMKMGRFCVLSPYRAQADYMKTKLSDGDRVGFVKAAAGG